MRRIIPNFSVPAGHVLSPLNCSIGNIFKRTPPTAEWTHFKKYARRMREFELGLPKEPTPLDVLSVLQLCTLDEPLLPNLKTVEFQKATADIIPSTPLLLSCRTTDIDIHFITSPPAVMVASPNV
ncbi:hypothetical protein BDM02DRAFT_1758053 [Thelephora ganbajun]|uniref:Uncharacterized protein n=1 Tax=Thelephora ganbajun TaxID=370292 RepID=A0ACB6Z1C7_THEGA|nr:hypothetical protein BDM02DRAFT_1758053 [Thelephora ganbajun]